MRPPTPRARAAALGVACLTALAARPAGGAGRPSGLGTSGLGADGGFAVVVHASNPAASLPREQVARLFLRKVKRWPSGAEAEPVDLAPGASAREAFTKRVLGKSVPTVRAYWQQRIFSGAEVPPPEKPGESDALDFVRTHPAAVAYVSSAAALPPGVRAVALTE